MKLLYARKAKVKFEIGKFEQLDPCFSLLFNLLLDFCFGQCRSGFWVSSFWVFVDGQQRPNFTVSSRLQL